METKMSKVRGIGCALVAAGFMFFCNAQPTAAESLPIALLVMLAGGVVLWLVRKKC
jgi:hypothetical protein